MKERKKKAETQRIMEAKTAANPQHASPARGLTEQRSVTEEREDFLNSYTASLHFSAECCIATSNLL